MSTPLRVLIVEDSEDDTELLVSELQRGGYDVTYERVQTAEAMKTALERRIWDIVFSDYGMPGFSGPAALALLQSAGLDLPFIIISGTIGEEIAVSSLKSGAHDFMVKGRLARLIPALQREIREVAERLARVQSQDALRRSEQSLATTLNSIGDAVIATDVNGHVVRMNPVAEALTGWHLEEAHGRPIDEIFGLLNEETRSPVESPTARVLREGVVVELASRSVLVAREGTERPVADTAAPIRDSRGEISGVVLVFRDQTEERRTEAMRVTSLQLEAQNLRILEASRLKSAFLTSMSHELRTPLNSVIGFAELMYNERIPPEMHKEVLGEILTSANHLLQLVNDLLDLSKVEAGKLQFYAEAVDLSEMIGEVLGVLGMSATSKSMQLESCVDPALTDIVLDPLRLKQVLYNYVSNAVKFTAQHGRVTIRAVPDTRPEAFRLEVEDTGIGIAAEDIGRLFVDFEQLETGSKRHLGTGLGLAITKRLVEAQGGSVCVRSTPGIGSVFIAVLPRRFAGATPGAVSPPAHLTAT